MLLLFGKLGMRDQFRKGRRLVGNLASLLGASGSASISEATDPPVFPAKRLFNHSPNCPSSIRQYRFLLVATATRGEAIQCGRPRWRVCPARPACAARA